MQIASPPRPKPLAPENFTNHYLQTYYQSIDPDEYAIAVFLSKEFKKITGKPKMLDVGCGPTLHHVLPAVPYVSKIDMADYLPSNLEAIQNWITKKNGAHNWNIFTKLTLDLQGKRAFNIDVEAYEEMLRHKIGGLSICDVLRKNPLGTVLHYPIVGCFYCTAEAATNFEEWKKAFTNVSDMVSPSGTLFFSSLWRTDYYSIRDDFGNKIDLPTAYIKKSDVVSLLEELNYDMTNTTVELVRTPQQVMYGVNGVIMVAARKPAFMQAK